MNILKDIHLWEYIDTKMSFIKFRNISTNYLIKKDFFLYLVVT